MADLIDRKELISALESAKVNCPDIFLAAVLHSAIQVVEAQPSVEAIPVTSALWVWGRNSINQYGVWCTNCGCGWEYKEGDFDRIEGLTNAHEYCPHCGANMGRVW